MLRGGIASTGITLKTLNIYTRAEIQILVQCHGIVERIEAPKHEGEAGYLGLNIHQQYSGVELPLPELP
jgi:hypothetical protein